MRRPFSPRTQRYARARAEANMVDRIRILRMGQPTMEDQDEDLVIEVTGAGFTIYDGKARVHRARGAGYTVVGDVMVDTRTTSVGIPWDAPVPRQDDVVVVDESSDADMVTRALQIRDVEGGGLLHDRRVLTCTGFTESRFWED